jgi:(R,R)-butanediol dehydrogenase/meso-butanediol dehydrogenase/diacetyl reductase
VIAEIKKLTNGEGADVSFECIGNVKTAPMAVDAVHNVGKVIIVGIFEGPSSFNFFSLSGTDKQVTGTLAYTIDDFARVAKLLASGALKAKPLITGRIKIDDIVTKGFEELVNHKENNIKILVSPN